jgi:hypothetical protein
LTPTEPLPYESVMTDGASSGIGRAPASGPQKQREPAAVDTESALARVREALSALRFGQITITVHDGQVVQIERTERVRIPVR